MDPVGSQIQVKAQAHPWPVPATGLVSEREAVRTTWVSGKARILRDGFSLAENSHIGLCDLLILRPTTDRNKLRDHVSDWPFPMTMNEISTTLSQLSIFGILLLRFARSRRDEERLKNELEAARAVQQVLVPEHIPTIPGFAIEAVYHPAGEVGGDFFQVIPAPSGGVLVVIGDVSGKGMPAAMTVSLLVGTVRTLAHYTQGPAEILAAMNQRILGRSSGGFTTAMVLRLDDDGTLTIANAGHLAPYNNGRELSIENGLPLGLASDVVYNETRLQLTEGDTLTLLSDGVVEAQSASGELFGFARTAAISTEPAEKVAQAAQAFGQTDDITVVTLTLAPALVLQA